jgi:predicted AlkP superfamily phosphohydrolase/phosphomutase
MLRSGKLPNLAKVIAGGASADDVIPVYPSVTAAGFASLWTGAPPRITGISGNRIPRLPRRDSTIVESVSGFNPALLRAETFWATAQRAGRRVVTVHVPFGAEQSPLGIHFQGYSGIAGRDGVVAARTAMPRTAASWANLPPSDAEPLEFNFSIAASPLFGLLIGDPSDSETGYDTVIVTRERDAANVVTRLKRAPAGPHGKLFWSPPAVVKSNAGHPATTYLRLFDLKPDGSDFLLYFTAPAREIISHPELVTGASPTVRAFIGDGASQLYLQGAFGRTIPNGGDGTAEARYLETASASQHQLRETARWALKHLPWDIFATYSPFPDNAEHLWRGHLDSTLPTFRKEIAERLRPFLEEIYRSCDEQLGALLELRPENSIVAVVSDHGLAGTHKRVGVNRAFQKAGLLTTEGPGRIDLAKTKVLYPAPDNRFLLINTTDRKQGIVAPGERQEVIERIREALMNIRDESRQVVTAIYDAATDGEVMGIGGEAGGDIYIDLLPGYEFDPRPGTGDLIVPREPHGAHGFNPALPSMRTLMVLHGRGIKPAHRLNGVRLIDFAPTFARLLGIPAPKEASGRILSEALADTR